MWPRRRRRIFTDDLGKTHDLRFGVLFLVVLALLFGSLYVVAAVTVGERLPSDASVGGIRVGGMSRGRALGVVELELAQRVVRPISVRAGPRSFRLVPRDAGLRFDPAASVDRAMGGGRWSPRHLLSVAAGGTANRPVLAVDARTLRGTVLRFRRAVSKAPVSSGVRFGEAGPSVVVGADGRTVDVGQAESVLRRAVVDGRRSVRIPVRPVRPRVTPRTAQVFLAHVAKPAVRGHITLRVGDRSIRVAGAVFGPALTASMSRGRLVLGADPADLRTRLRPALSVLPGSPRDARIRIRRHKVVILPGRTGVTADPDALASAVVSAAVRHGRARVAQVALTPQPPAFTAAAARALRVRREVASYVVRFRAPKRRRHGLRLAVVRLNGTIVHPGAQIGIAATVGTDIRRSTASFVASVFASAAFRAGLVRVEAHYRRGRDLRFPPGRDVSIGTRGDDLRMRNASPYGVLVHAYVTRGRLGGRLVHVELWSTRYWTVRAGKSGRYDVRRPRTEIRRGAACRPSAGVRGFRLDVVQSLIRHHSVRKVVSWPIRYPGRPRIVCRRR
jgi:vancomycin resistance protein YoaR